MAKRAKQAWLELAEFSQERIDAIVEKGRPEVPKEIKFVTYTLRYNDCAWVTVEALGSPLRDAQ
jgi:hypothetical protein